MSLLKDNSEINLQITHYDESFKFA